MTGRPSKYTEALADEIVRDISEGITLSDICRRDHMPNRATVYAWMRNDDELSQRIAGARDLGHDAIAERVRRTARGYGLDREGDSTGDVQRDKLIIETDLKLLAKWDKRYADRSTHEVVGNGGGPIKSSVEVVFVEPGEKAE